MERVAEQGGDPRPLPEHRLLGQRRLRHLRGGPHLLRHHRGSADGAAGGAAGRAWCARPRQFDPVANPEAALERRNLVITADARAGDDRRGRRRRQALAEPLGIVDPLGTQPNGCIGAGDAGFFCKYVAEYLAEAGFSAGADQRAAATRSRRTLDRNAMEKMRAVADRRGAGGPAERRQRHGDRGARAGQAPGAGDGVEPHVRARRRRSRRPATGCRTSRSTWARARSTRSSPRPRRWRRAWASTTR